MSRCHPQRAWRPVAKGTLSLRAEGLSPTALRPGEKENVRVTTLSRLGQRFPVGLSERKGRTAQSGTGGSMGPAARPWVEESIPLLDVPIGRSGEAPWGPVPPAPAA